MGFDCTMCHRREIWSHETFRRICLDCCIKKIPHWEQNLKTSYPWIYADIKKIIAMNPHIYEK